MFNSGNSTPFTMPVQPAYSGNGGGNGMNGWGGDWIWILVVFALLFGWGGNGWGNNGNGGSNGGGVMDAYVLNSDFATLQRQLDSGFSGVTAGINQVNNGLCNGFYQQAQLVNGVQMQIANEARTTDNAICNLGTSVMQGFNQSNVTALQNANAIQSQLADCCCENRAAIAQVRYDMATNNCATINAISQAARDITDNQNANYRALHDEIIANRIEDKNALIAQQQQQIFQYQLAASQAGQTADIKNGILTELRNCPVGTYPVPNPNCCYGTNVTFTSPYAGYNNGNGCGCNSGCC